MAPDILEQPRQSKRGEPVWQMATFFPLQGDWTEEDYLWLDTNRLVEYRDGMLEFLPMPSYEHQLILGLLHELLCQWARQHSGKAILAPMPLATVSKTYREPDVMYIRDAKKIKRKDRRLTNATLVIEVVSEGAGNRNRDYVEKRDEYAQAGVPEYWIVDPKEETVHVLSLKDGEYAEFQSVGFDGFAKSQVLVGFEVRVADAFADEDE